MTRIATIRPEFVEFIPKSLQGGVLYISRRYNTASHLCACGCGSKVVTPLNPSGWVLTTRSDAITLRPSIGSWSLPCQSHYWISDGRIEWAPQFTQHEIDAVRRDDRRSQQAHFDSPRSLWQRFWRWLRG